jgi:two-component system, OmpR family, heavy metal sensor histidine kinase CusS
MTIRARLTLWYAGILLISLVVMAGVLHYEFTEEQQALRQNRTPPDSPWEETGEIILYYGLPTALLLLVGGWSLMRRALAPITALTQAAERIHVNNLKEHLPCTKSGDELDRLTEVFNAMTARLDDSFSRIREFTLHASHELKTPLTVLRGELETAMRDLAATPAQREHFVSLLDEIQRLAKIVDGLTLLAKADAGQVALALEPVQLDELVRDSFADAQILGQPGHLKVELTACEEVLIRGDRHRLRQLLLNLTDNAIKYNRPDGSVAIELHRNGKFAELNIANTGGGISPALLPRVFDRFFRGEPSHNSAVEGCGLGLSISRWIVKVHGGDIRITSELGQMTTVTVSLPLGKV